MIKYNDFMNEAVNQISRKQLEFTKQYDKIIIDCIMDKLINTYGHFHKVNGKTLDIINNMKNDKNKAELIKWFLDEEKIKVDINFYEETKKEDEFIWTMTIKPTIKFYKEM